MKTAIQFAECALLPKWDKYTYDKMDCQGFVERVLSDLGVRKPNGKPYDWRGSNSMYRNYYSWRGTTDECLKQFGKIPVGAFVLYHRAYHDCFSVYAYRMDIHGKVLRLPSLIGGSYVSFYS